VSEARSSLRIYRVQDAGGRGPFRPGFSAQWLDDELAPDRLELPPWTEEFGFHLIQLRGKPGEHFGTATRSIDGLRKWFSPTEQAKLRLFGYNIASFEDARVLAESEHQLVFARARPLNRGAIIVPWEAMSWAA
jgi:hypothetical protein